MPDEVGQKRSLAWRMLVEQNPPQSSILGELGARWNYYQKSSVFNIVVVSSLKQIQSDCFRFLDFLVILHPHIPIATLGKKRYCGFIETGTFLTASKPQHLFS
ncbi:hypothetical protein ACOSQ4_009298 [Xanthoceras sorbifolium]